MSPAPTRSWSISAPSMPNGAPRSSVALGAARTARHAVGARPGFHRTLAGARAIRPRAVGAQAGGGAAQPARIRCAVRRRSGRRSGGAVCAKPIGTIVALTGKHDVVTDGERSATIANGDPLMSLVTAMGCAGSALVCAALAVETDAWLATSAALLALGVAGEVAAQSAPGSGPLRQLDHRRAPQPRSRDVARAQPMKGVVMQRFRDAGRSSPQCHRRSGAFRRPRSRRTGAAVRAKAARRSCNCATSSAKPAPWSRPRARSRKRWRRFAVPLVINDRDRCRARRRRRRRACRPGRHGGGGCATTAWARTPSSGCRSRPWRRPTRRRSI